MASPSGRYHTHIRFSKPFKQGEHWYCYEYVLSRGNAMRQKKRKARRTFRYKMLIKRSYR